MDPTVKQRQRIIIGTTALAAYVALIILANWAIGRYGFIWGPAGTVPAGTYFAGAVFVARDAVRSRVADRTRETAPARQAFLERFEDQVDPDRKFPADVRERMAANARSAYFRSLRARGLEKAIAR